ncbi:DNA-binding transcriptional regulator GbsR, MarR family [Beijerinckia sp. 28-YEA-48]|nr:DNA-binding transcriptional regulator GbsR, MarR family [Beijerinckia sp. 28-YEA-48]
MSNLEPDQRRFIDEIARLFVPWGVPQSAASLYGYLLLRPEAADLDEIVRDLEISKSSASVAGRLLEQYMLARRLRVRGSKRILYEVSENYEEMLSQQNRLLEALANQLLAGAEVSQSKKIQLRLKEMATFNLAARDAMKDLLRAMAAKRRG